MNLSILSSRNVVFVTLQWKYDAAIEIDNGFWSVYQAIFFNTDEIAQSENICACTAKSQLMPTKVFM